MILSLRKLFRSFSDNTEVDTPTGPASSRSSIYSNESARSNRSLPLSLSSFFGLEPILQREETSKELSAKVIREIILPLREAEDLLKTGTSVIKASMQYERLKPKALSLYKNCKAIDSRVQQNSLWLVEVAKLRTTLDENVEIRSFLDDPTTELSDESAKILLRLLDNPFIQDYLAHDHLTEPLSQYQKVFEELIDASTLVALDKFKTVPANRLSDVFRKVSGEALISLVENSASESSKLQELFTSLFFSKRSLFTLLLFQIAPPHEKLAFRKLYDYVKNFIKEECHIIGSDHTARYLTFKHFLEKTFPLLSVMHLDELESKENNYFLIKLYASIFGKGIVDAQDIQRQLIPVEVEIIPSLLEKLNLSDYKSRMLPTTDIPKRIYNSYLQSLRGQKIRFEEHRKGTIFEESFKHYKTSHNSALLDQVQKDMDRGIVIRVDGIRYRNASLIYQYLMDKKNKSSEEALRLMSAMQQGAMSFTNNAVKQVFLGDAEKQSLFIHTDPVRVDHNSCDFAPIEIEVDLRDEDSPVVVIQSEHKITQSPNPNVLFIRNPSEDGLYKEGFYLQNEDSAEKELCRLKALTRIEGTHITHFMDIQ